MKNGLGRGVLVYSVKMKNCDFIGDFDPLKFIFWFDRDWMTPSLRLVIISANKDPLTHLLFLQKREKNQFLFSLERKGIEKKCQVTEMTAMPILVVKVAVAMVVPAVVIGLDMEKEG